MAATTIEYEASSLGMSSDMAAIDYDLSPLVAEKAAILAEAEAQGCLRIFGYGSLVWRPSFPFLKESHGWIKHHARRFFQASPDHRGTPTAMGRVCALIKAPGEVTHGTVFDIDTKEASSVLDELFFREKAGYSMEFVDVILSTSGGDGNPEIIRALTFTADETGLFWAGPRSKPFEVLSPSPIVASSPSLSSCHSADNSHCTVETIGTIIATAVGPSGTNVQYLARLLKAMRERRLVDGHLEELWEVVVRVRTKLGMETIEVEKEGLPTITMMIESMAKTTVTIMR
jgi:glutathione-specific gamma-glutamylcyclotransferase